MFRAEDRLDVQPRSGGIYVAQRVSVGNSVVVVIQPRSGDISTPAPYEMSPLRGWA
jgi:hypothetical protein